MKNFAFRVSGFAWWMVRVTALVLFAAALARAQGPATVTVSDVIYASDGTAASGHVRISWPHFNTADGKTVASGSMTVQIGAAGAFSVALAPNEGATPIGTYYTINYLTGDRGAKAEYWTVPAAGPVTIAAIRTNVGNPNNVALTVRVGSVTTGAPGTDVSVTNGGSASNAVFNFTIPRGDVGPAGAAESATVFHNTRAANGDIFAVDPVTTGNSRGKFRMSMTDNGANPGQADPACGTMHDITYQYGYNSIYSSDYNAAEAGLNWTMETNWCAGDGKAVFENYLQFAAPWAGGESFPFRPIMWQILKFPATVAADYVAHETHTVTDVGYKHLPTDAGNSIYFDVVNGIVRANKFGDAAAGNAPVIYGSEYGLPSGGVGGSRNAVVTTSQFHGTCDAAHVGNRVLAAGDNMRWYTCQKDVADATRYIWTSDSGANFQIFSQSMPYGGWSNPNMIPVIGTYGVRIVRITGRALATITCGTMPKLGIYAGSLGGSSWAPLWSSGSATYDSGWLNLVVTDATFQVIQDIGTCTAGTMPFTNINVWVEQIW